MSATETGPAQFHGEPLVNTAERDLEDLIGDQSLLTSTDVVVTEPRHRIEKRAFFVWTIEAMWSWLILAALQIWWFVWAGEMGYWNWVAAGLTAIFASMNIIVAPYWRYRVARWDVSPTAICSRTGWWTVQFRVAPLSRLQTVYTTRNLFERIGGLSTVQAAIASSSGSVSIRGLKKDDAEKLAGHLIAIAELDQGDAT